MRRLFFSRVLSLLFIGTVPLLSVYGQDKMDLKAYVAIENNYDTRADQLSFGFGELDLFMTADLSDKFSFLGESVFKYSSNTFKLGVERIIVKYNFKGNHNLLLGRHHTPLIYWNDTYHHGRLFFPTVGRPAIFTYKIIPIHTNGVSVSGHNLTSMKIGYDVMVGNGIGSTSEMVDNDKSKSLSLAAHIKPIEGFRVGGSMYIDRIAIGGKTPGGTAATPIDQQVISGHIKFYKSGLELLAEASSATNKARHNDMNDGDSLVMAKASASYLYIGYNIKNFVPYVRYDYVNFGKEEMFYNGSSLFLFNVALGLRYEISYKAIVKLEYLYTAKEVNNESSSINFQLAVGF